MAQTVLSYSYPAVRPISLGAIPSVRAEGCLLSLVSTERHDSDLSISAFDGEPCTSVLAEGTERTPASALDPLGESVHRVAYFHERTGDRRGTPDGDGFSPLVAEVLKSCINCLIHANLRCQRRNLSRKRGRRTLVANYCPQPSASRTKCIRCRSLRWAIKPMQRKNRREAFL